MSTPTSRPGRRAQAPAADPDLSEYATKRRKGKTPEPMPTGRPRRTRGRSAAPTFVIQEHHASSLHWDFRLERDGVLVSWALPKGLPRDPDVNHLAVPTEDHPMEYGGFAGTIPAGEYGAGRVTIWDHGTYTCEKWTPREVMVVLHGERVDGRYVLFPTGERRWMIHRMDPRPADDEPMPERPAPMLATAGPLAVGRPDEWAYEFKWDGVRAIVRIEDGRPRATTRNGNDITRAVPELRPMAEALGSRPALLDGELIVLGEGGVPSFPRVARRVKGSGTDADRARDPVSFVVFDLLYLDGRSLLRDSYDERRRLLEAALPSGDTWAVTPSFTGVPGTDVLRGALDLGMEGVVAKRRTSTYLPGKRSADWIKTKLERTQEVVIGGWTPGEGSRKGTFGALVVGVPNGAEGPRPLTFVGKVGTGFSEDAREELLAAMRRLSRSTPPFDPVPPSAVARTATWVRPVIVGEVSFREWTPSGHLRHPVWRGLRSDKSADEVVREP